MPKALNNAMPKATKDLHKEIYSKYYIYRERSK